MRKDINIEYFKERLLAEESSLLEELGRIASPNKEERDGWMAKPEDVEGGAIADLNERADRLEDFEERRATENELSKQLEQVRRALQKIEEGTYGICDVSGEEIEAARLEANPAAATLAKYAK